MILHFQKLCYKNLASRSPDVPNQIDTRFNLGSMDKMFTAVAVMQLVEQGRLSLDGRISDYWPDYPNQEVARKVTIHQLLGTSKR